MDQNAPAIISPKMRHALRLDGVKQVGGNKSKFAAEHKCEDRLAQDVAHLYSLAKIDGAPYRDFSRFKNHPAQLLTPNGAPPAALALAESAESVQVHCESPTLGEPDVAYPERRTRFAVAGRKFRPAMAIYSLSGGVGKTTLAANIGRALHSAGQRVLLVDASGCCLLPFYFGANDLHPGLHTFFDPHSDCAPLCIISTDRITPAWIAGEVKAGMDTAYWTIFDLGPAATAVLPQILEMCAFVLIPLLPDLNSILSVARIEPLFESMRRHGAGIPSPFYLFNRFDSEDPVDEGAYELVRRQCGGRLLPWFIHNDVEAARAIASRRTVVDYAPDAELANASSKLAALLERAVEAAGPTSLENAETADE
jgi:cellulose biosynthesis protein BcsQ